MDSEIYNGIASTIGYFILSLIITLMISISTCSYVTCNSSRPIVIDTNKIDTIITCITTSNITKCDTVYSIKN